MSIDESKSTKVESQKESKIINFKRSIPEESFRMILKLLLLEIYRFLNVLVRHAPKNQNYMRSLFIHSFW